MAGLAIYDFDQYIISFNGIPIEGFANGTAVSLTPEGPLFNDDVGVDGQVTRTKNNDNRWTCTFSLMQTSSSNPLLSAVALLDSNSPNGAGVGALLIKDLNGTTVFVGAQAWIQKWPELTLERTPTARDWEIRIGQGEPFIGGN